jgi:glycosyltransferase involved in cell wall biosynthesis
MIHSGAVSWVVIVLAWLLAFVWLRRMSDALRGVPAMLDLTEIDPKALPALSEGDAPHVSVIVPARDEADTIATTLRSLLAQTGVRLQIIAVDDRSIDGTSEKMDALAIEANNGRHQLKVVHIRELPSGWLGKPHALARGVDQSTAPWLLFTDGDVVFAPEAVHLSLQCAIRENVDHFVLAPTLVSDTLGAKATQATAQVLAHFITCAWKISDPNSKDAFGVGGFNLVRKDAVAALGGIERLHLEVVEDVALGSLIKRELGRRSYFALGLGLVRIHWIKGTFGIVRLLEKNAFAGTRFSVTMTLLSVLSLLLHALIPFAALTVGPWGIAAAVSMYVGVAMGFTANRKLNGLSPWFAALFAPCALVMAWAILRSMVLTLARGGVVWRGTLYPLAELKKGMIRFRIV